MTEAFMTGEEFTKLWSYQAAARKREKAVEKLLGKASKNPSERYFTTRTDCCLAQIRRQIDKDRKYYICPQCHKRCGLQKIKANS